MNIDFLKFKLAHWVLFTTSFYDMYRGLMHTALADIATADIAKVPKHIGETPEYLMVMNGFGFSNFSSAAVKMYAVLFTPFLISLLPIICSFIIGI